MQVVVQLHYIASNQIVLDLIQEKEKIIFDKAPVCWGIITIAITLLHL